MENRPSEEKLLASDSHHGWHLAGWLIAMIAVLAGTSAVVIARMHSVSVERARLNDVADAGPHVMVTRPQAASAERQLTLPATIQGYVETPVFAKIAGYLKEIRVDKGDRIRKGEVLAILESPELDAQVADAKHNLWLQSITDTRNQGLVLKHGISQQTADNSRGSMLQARDTYTQLRAMQAYEVMTAPQNVANLIYNGAPATISVEQRPGRDITARITRHPEALDSTTRMMLMEADLRNSDGALYPGMYGTMSVTVKVPASAPLVSDDVLVFRDDKVLVPVVRNSIVHLAPVTLGYDNGYAVEVTSGISMNDLIAVNLGQSASEGERVQPIEQKS